MDPVYARQGVAVFPQEIRGITCPEDRRSRSDELDVGQRDRLEMR